MTAPARWLPLAVLAALALAAAATLTLGITRAAQGDLSETINTAVRGDRFSLTDFELESVLNKWLGEVGALISGRRDSGDGADRVLTRFFRLQTEITAAVRDGVPADEVNALRAERCRLENRVERILEGRISSVLRDSGFSRALPLFGGQQILWPPLDTEIQTPPRVLTVSPRAEIRLQRTVLLEADLAPAEIAAIEAALEASGEYSALVDTIGGVAAFPAIVRATRTYPSLVDTIAHEWVHHYLFFYPLGRAFFDSTNLRTINETVANMVAAEITPLVLAAYPQVNARPPSSLPSPATPATSTRAQTDALLFDLRREVDALLARGDIDTAERRMEEVRLQLQDLGRNIRRINQAFFAFNGVYADRPESSSPIGPILRDLRAQSPSLIAFMQAVRGVTTPAGLEALLGAPDGG